MTTSNNQRLRKEARDGRLGQEIADAIRAQGAGEPCPSPEEMTALVEGVLPEQESDRLFGHMAACSRCDEIFRLSCQLSEARLDRDQEEEPTGRSTATSSATSFRRHPYLYSGLAAAAMLVIAISLVIDSPKAPKVASLAPDTVRPQSAPLPQPSAEQTTVAKAPVKKPAKEQVMVASNLDFTKKAAGLLAAAGVDAKLINPQPAARGYGSKVPAGLYQTGVLIMRSQVALTLGDRNLAAAELKALVAAVPKTSPLADVGARLRSALLAAEPVPPELLNEFSAALSSAMAEKTGMVLLGVWVEGSRLAAQRRSEAYFSSPWFSAEARRLQQAGLSKEAAVLVSGIKKAATPPIAEAGFLEIITKTEEAEEF
jgi:hypothetical protein